MLWQARRQSALAKRIGFVLPNYERAVVSFCQKCRWFRFAKMPAHISNVGQPIDNISLFQLQRSVNPKAIATAVGGP
jgi:hypothetical protein